MNVALPSIPLDHKPREMLLCFSHLRWNFVFQRPQHLLLRAARNYEVHYWEEPVFQDIPAPRLHREIGEQGVNILVPHLPHVTGGQATVAQREMLSDFLYNSRMAPSVLWYYTPMALQFSRGIDADLVVYDNMDELSAFHGAPPQVVALENEMFATSDVVFTGGQSLYEAKKGRHANIHAFPSSIDAAHFHKARRPGGDPPDQAGIVGPRLGFFGVVDERMDLGLLAQVADLRPDWQFIMIGPIVKIDPQTLPKRENIHWLGPKSYKELPSYLAHWDAGFMPFALNDATRFISPTKTPEFLAAGLPVLSTRIKDVVRPYGERGLVEIIDGPEDFCTKAQLLLAKPRKDWFSTIDRFLALNSWDKTWSAMQDHMDDIKLRTATNRRPAVAHV